MERCPFCHKLPSVNLVQMGCVELWELGCDVHFPRIARQPNLEMATEEWNGIVREVSAIGRAA